MEGAVRAVPAASVRVRVLCLLTGPEADAALACMQLVRRRPCYERCVQKGYEEF